jgi:asparagine N-glycosylation enzyme membrane subunit Stt3
VQDHATIAERTDVVYVKRSIAPNGERRMVIFPAYFSLIGVQLHESDGRAFDVKVAKGSRLPHFRLVYEGNSDPAERGVIRMIPVKIFEVVRGARVKGQVQPSTEVNASVMIKTNIGRSFKYSAAATADGRGHFEMILPYSTTGGAAPVQAEGDYTLTCGSPRSNPQQSVGPGLERGEQKTTVRVPESVVEGGGRVQVVWPKQKMRP